MLYTIRFHDHTFAYTHDFDDLDAAIRSQLEELWLHAGCVVFRNDVPLAVLTTFHAEDDKAGCVSVTRFDGPVPAHAIYHVRYRNEIEQVCDDFVMPVVIQITEEQLMQVA